MYDGWPHCDGSRGLRCRWCHHNLIICCRTAINPARSGCCVRQSLHLDAVLTLVSANLNAMQEWV